MNDPNALTGRLFSNVYLPRDIPQSDSVRMRIRLAAYLAVLEPSRSKVIKVLPHIIKTRLGVVLETSPLGYTLWDKFFESAELRDVLDSITLIYNALLAHADKKSVTFWKNSVAEIFKEEGVHYCLDSNCGVHFSIDTEFERTLASPVATLDNPRYTAARQAYDSAQDAISRTTPNFKEALRNIFLAVEVVFKAMYPDTRLINATGISERLKPSVIELYSDNTTACEVAAKYTESMADWVNGIHYYRHGQPTESASQPPLDLSVALTSSGVAFLRWLISVDQALLSQQK